MIQLDGVHFGSTVHGRTVVHVRNPEMAIVRNLVCKSCAKFEDLAV